MTKQAERLAYTIAGFCTAGTISRTKVYEEINSGRLKTVKVGRRRLITAEEAHDYFRRLAAEQAAPALPCTKRNQKEN